MIGLLNFTHFVSSAGYAAVFVLSLLQSCCVPTSSELTLGFAGVLASQGKLSLAGVIAAGAGGELVGAYIAWFVGRWGGRPFVERYGRYVLLRPEDLDRAERWYQRHERWGVFASRLLPVIRNFVAVPAGVAEVPLVRFGILTLLGSVVWDGAMALIGYEAGNSYQSVMHKFSYAGYLLGAAAVVAIAFVVWHRWHSYHSRPAPGLAPGHRGGGRAGAGRAGGGRAGGDRAGGDRAGGDRAGGDRVSGDRVAPEATYRMPSGYADPPSLGIPPGASNQFRRRTSRAPERPPLGDPTPVLEPEPGD